MRIQLKKMSQPTMKQLSKFFRFLALMSFIVAFYLVIVAMVSLPLSFIVYALFLLVKSIFTAMPVIHFLHAWAATSLILMLKGGAQSFIDIMDLFIK